MRILESKKNISHRSINLALSARGLSALKNTTLGLDEKILEYAIPMNGRMIHVDEDKLKSQSYGVFGEVRIFFLKLFILLLLCYIMIDVKYYTYSVFTRWKEKSFSNCF